ncbi:hypothetical protein LAZ29_05015 [Cereibacter sphaeroides]|uniref:hypothetical protein n=1 Tax=Cereibacter sphaeroides TaxID=1063 RepID=UPI001F23806A|nr:hypothetical protein [Cereibacter sphaeroides]MCE6950277.1 hypothetical protein [Cereibacter sphaeroides]
MTSMFSCIQPALWPESGISTEISTYFKISGPVGTSLSKGGLTFAPGGSVEVDGYFNLFNLGKWRNLCGLDPIGLWLKGKGRFQLTVWLAQPGRSWERTFDEIVILDGEFSLPLEGIEIQGSGILFFGLTALAEGEISDFGWITTAPPRRRPDLIISVTTFKREEAVAVTIDRFRRFRAASPLRDHIRMFVADNGQSLTVEPDEAVTIFPNANLGGAGGFSRGLLEARKAGATHCLFMDDDASTHMEAITRTWMCLAYALDPRTAVAGGMLNGDYRWQLWENGAIFDRGCKPLYFGCDLRDRQAVFNMEFETTAPAPSGFYGGWWFFAFPVDKVQHMPFPFFVRGDDVSFSLVNDLRIVTLPGVASAQESFIDKASPQTWYLDMRSHLAHHLSLPQKSISWGKLQRMFFNFYLRTVLRYHYDSLSAVNLAIEDVLRGPQFFAEHADMAQRRRDLKEMTRTEIWTPLSFPPRPRHGRASRPLRALLLMTLNGHLLPFADLFGSDLVVEAWAREDFRQVYGARQITYVNRQRNSTYMVRRSRRRFWQESLRLLKNSFKLRRAYRRLQDEWQGNYPALTSDRFWQEKLKLSAEADRPLENSGLDLETGT